MATSATLKLAIDYAAEVCKDALSGITDKPVIAQPYFPFSADRFPYFSIRPGPFTRELGRTNTMIGTQHSAVIRMVVAHLTSGYKGENSDNLYTWYAALLTQFDNRPYLTSTTYPTQLAITPPGALLTGAGPVSVFAAGGIASQQIGVEFTLEFTIHTDLNRRI